jgi:hypothetical protein
MTSRITSLALASFFALVFALVAHAGEVSMDIGNTQASSPTLPCSCRGDLGESATAAADIAGAETTTGSGAGWSTSATTRHRRQLADGTDAGSTDASTASSSSANAISAQVKPRNRWQSIVPGAIK